MLLIKCYVLPFIGHYIEIKEVFISFFHYSQQTGCDAIALVIGMNQQIMKKSHHLSIIQGTDKSDQFIAIPCRNDKGR